MRVATTIRAGWPRSLLLHAIRVHTCVDSEVLRIPELLSLVGRTVEVIIVADTPNAAEVAAPRVPQLGTLRGMVEVPDDFDAPLPEDATLVTADHLLPAYGVPLLWAGAR